jgi:hypothetical protein
MKQQICSEIKNIFAWKCPNSSGGLKPALDRRKRLSHQDIETSANGGRNVETPVAGAVIGSGAYGIQKSTISEHFIEASRQRLDKLLARSLGEYAIGATPDGRPPLWIRVVSYGYEAHDRA